MRDLFRFIVWAVVDLFRSRAAIEAEILTLRQQIIVLRRTTPKKQSFGAIDRLVFVGLYRFFPRVSDALAIVRPGTVIKWHRAGFRFYWHWKSRPQGGRPTVPLEIRRLIREMSIANPLWGAPRIHGELLKLGIAIGQTSVAKYQIYGQAKRSAVPRVEDVPPQSCRRHRRDGSVRRADNLVPPALWFVDHGAWQTTGHMVRSNNASDRGMDRKPVHRSLRMGAASSPLSDPRSRWSVWRSFHPTTSVNGHSRSADAAAFPMAKRICRTADRFDPTRMPRPRRGVRRVPPPSPTAVVHEILQWRPHASILGEGCAGLACRRTGRADPLSPHSRRAAPPICPDLIFDRHRSVIRRPSWTGNESISRNPSGVPI